jgi:hypothetical protein
MKRKDGESPLTWPAEVQPKRRGTPRPVRRRVSPWTRRSPLELDGRTVEAKREKAIACELGDHLGGDLSPPQRLLVQRASRLVILIEQIERSIIERRTLSDLGSRQLLALVNSLRLILHELGIERREQAPKRLGDLITVKGGRAA